MSQESGRADTFSRLLVELADEQEWTTRFNATTNQQWDRLTELARQEISVGDTDSLDDVVLLKRP